MEAVGKTYLLDIRQGIVDSEFETADFSAIGRELLSNEKLAFALIKDVADFEDIGRFAVSHYSKYRLDHELEEYMELGGIRQ